MHSNNNISYYAQPHEKERKNPNFVEVFNEIECEVCSSKNEVRVKFCACDEESEIG